MNFRTLLDSLDIGDVIRVTDYYIGRMAVGGPFREESRIGTEAVVTGFQAYHYKNISHSRYEVEVRGIATEKGNAVWMSFDGRRSGSFELVRKGNGTCTPGVDYQLSEHEIWVQEADKVKKQINDFDWRYEGFANRATYTAHLYLCNEARFEQMLPGLRRRNGTINSNKVEKAFRDLRLRLEPEVFEAPFQIDAKFRNAQLGLGVKVQVNWAEVAHEFRLKDEDK